MAVSLGIDLGSSQSRLASIPLNFTLESPTWEGSIAVYEQPTCLSLDAQNSFQMAAPGSVAEPLVGFKQALDGATELWQRGEEQFSAMELSSILLKRLYQTISPPISRIHPAVVTYPNYFLSLGRDHLALAAKFSGFNVGYLISEGAAVANFYADKYQLKGKCLVVNWGASSLSLDAIEIGEEQLAELTSEYSRSWGSGVIDTLIFDLYDQRYQEIKGLSLFTEDDHKCQQFIYSAEKAKILLGTAESINIQLGNEADGFVQMELNQALLSNAITPLLTHLQFLAEQVAQNLQMGLSEFDHVILTGGSAHLVGLKSKLEQLSGKSVYVSDQPAHDVAIGAALYGLKPKALDTVAHHSYGTATLGVNPKTQAEEMRNSILIPKGSPLPGTLTQAFATSSEGDDMIELDITEGEDHNLDYTRNLGRASVRLYPCPPAGSEIRLTLECDRFERISAKVFDVVSAKQYQTALAVEGAALTHQKQNSYTFRELMKAL